MPRRSTRLIGNIAALASGAVKLQQYLDASQARAAVAAAPPPDRMAGLAPLPELQRHRMRAGAFPLGRLHPDHGANFEAGIHDDRHIFMVAGNRSGKGLTMGLPAALTWEGPFFSIDPKGEMASIAALRRASYDLAKGTGTSVRHFIGQQVGILDPLGQVRGPARAFLVNYNPLTDIDMATNGGVRSIRAAASSIVTPEMGNGGHFSETAETIIAGLIEAVKVKEPPERQTLTQCRSVLLAGYDALIAYLKSAVTPAALAQEAATVVEEVGADEWGSHRSTMSRNMKWLADPQMQAHLAPSAFSLRKAITDGWSVFVALPPDEIANFKGWLRLIVRQVLDARMKGGVMGLGANPTLCLLDEFPTLGAFSIIKESAGYMAGYGLKLVPIIQNIGQVREHYPQSWETFLGNAGAIIAWGLNDMETEQYIADRLGKVAVSESSSGVNFQGLTASRSSNTARHDRPVRFPNEIHEQGARETGRAFVVPASGAGFTIARVPYTALGAGFYDAPDFIEQWERQNWR